MPLALADDKVDTWLDLSIESPLDKDLLLDLKEFTVRPMDRAAEDPSRHRSRGRGGLRQVRVRLRKVTAKQMRRAGLPAASSWAPIW